MQKGVIQSNDSIHCYTYTIAQQMQHFSSNQYHGMVQERRYAKKQLMAENGLVGIWGLLGFGDTPFDLVFHL